ncbi:hypothetical protein HPP92_002444 [Vanilla planifolia]|uniref:Uncharacterized protein n=1 Tax=Vanilla planifolia TaxID=51239 RepID=A0A835VHZ3_VANPL|nr:hypothetical protein HPP92_002444 [Vanilla planifolia]
MRRCMMHSSSEQSGPSKWGRRYSPRDIFVEGKRKSSSMKVTWSKANILVKEGSLKTNIFEGFVENGCSDWDCT